MLYMELYLYDYLKKKGRAAEIEIWGENRGNDFYICHLGPGGAKGPFYKAHMQYLGNYRDLADTDKKRPALIYERGGELYRKEMTVYVAKETEQIENFLIREKLTGERPGRRAPAGRIRKRAYEPALSGTGFFLRAAACLILIFLAANMVDALSGYENMQEVIAVVELLTK